MQCYICGAEMERIKKDVDATWMGRNITFRGLDVWYCAACEEEAYEPDDVRLMQGLIKGTLKDREYPEIMNVGEVADLLRVSNQTVYNLVTEGRLPATKIGREWRFSRPRIMELLACEGSRGQTMALEREASIAIAARDTGDDGISSNDSVIIQKHLAAMGQG
jgi:excisionase family DNA binding protein/YgiT-type zinc finger domain-containing protein